MRVPLLQPAFVDADGDKDLDLLVGGSSGLKLFRRVPVPIVHAGCVTADPADKQSEKPCHFPFEWPTRSIIDKMNGKKATLQYTCQAESSSSKPNLWCFTFPNKPSAATPKYEWRKCVAKTGEVNCPQSSLAVRVAPYLVNKGGSGCTPTKQCNVCEGGQWWLAPSVASPRLIACSPHKTRGSHTTTPWLRSHRHCST